MTKQKWSKLLVIRCVQEDKLPSELDKPVMLNTGNTGNLLQKLLASAKVGNQQNA
jgi:hypothetical protein